jgi:phosphinothricin acetyltransferase
MHSLFYRNANEADLEKIVAIYNSTVGSRMVTADTEPVTLESRQAWFAGHNPQKRPLWVVADSQNQTIGWVSFQSFYGRPAYDVTAEISIYLDAEHRGNGRGKVILQHCMEQAPMLGIKTLLAFIFGHNEPSLRLFRHMGFQEWAMLPKVALLDGQERDLKILGKRVAP